MRKVIPVHLTPHAQIRRWFSYIVSVHMTLSPEPALDAYPRVDVRDLYAACSGRPRMIKRPARVPTRPSLEPQNPVLPASLDLAQPRPVSSQTSAT